MDNVNLETAATTRNVGLESVKISPAPHAFLISNVLPQMAARACVAMAPVVPQRNAATTVIARRALVYLGNVRNARETPNVEEANNVVAARVSPENAAKRRIVPMEKSARTDSAWRVSTMRNAARERNAVTEPAPAHNVA